MIDLVKSYRTPLQQFDLWSLTTLVIVALILVPLLAIFWLAFFPTENVWPHLVSTVLPRYVANSLTLMISVAICSGVIGVCTAWAVVMYQFPGRRWMEWALLLPLAVPAYIGAYAFVDFFEFAGAFQTTLRDIFGWQTSRDYWFPELRSMGGAIFIISLSLYPYVYMFTRAAYLEQSGSAIEVSRALGCGPWASFCRVGLPLARPAIVAGIAVVMMETLNDFGTVEYFAVQTLTAGIFTTWLEGSNLGAAAQIACVMFLLVLVMILAERYSRRKLRVHQSARSVKKTAPTRLTGRTGWTISIACALPILLGFVMPVAIMVDLAISIPDTWFSADVITATLTSIWVASIAAIVTVAGALVLIYAVRLSTANAPRILAPVTSVGYVMPGAVLGLGVVITLSRADHLLADLIELTTGAKIGLVLYNTWLHGLFGRIALCDCVSDSVDFTKLIPPKYAYPKHSENQQQRRC